jgi:hypothetical protein
MGGTGGLEPPTSSGRGLPTFVCPEVRYRVAPKAIYRSTGPFGEEFDLTEVILPGAFGFFGAVGSDWGGVTFAGTTGLVGIGV